MKPTVGTESTDYSAACQYSADPAAPQCTEAASLHIRVICLEYGEVSLASCARHASIARATGIYRDEHPFAGFCGLPATLWLGSAGCDLETVGTR